MLELKKPKTASSIRTPFARPRPASYLQLMQAQLLNKWILVLHSQQDDDMVYNNGSMVQCGCLPIMLLVFRALCACA